MGEISAASAVGGTRKIDSRLSTALNVVRALAACYVVIHHVVMNSSLSGPVTYLFRFGQEAVIVFFLLSGFLVFAFEKNRIATDVRGYYLRRFRRIYPPLIIAMGVTALVAWLNGSFAANFSILQLALNMLSLQDVSALKPGVIADPFMGDSPLWSLSYEVFFYLVFPLVMIASRKLRWNALTMAGTASAVGYASYLVAPNHISLVLAYFIVWWAGAVIADLLLADRMSFVSLLPLIAWLTALCAVAAVGVGLFGKSDVGVFPMLPLRHFAFALICVVLSTTSLPRLFVRSVQSVAMPAAYIASISYGLYVFHFPLLIQWDFAHSPAGFLIALTVLIGVSVAADRKLDQVLPRPAKRRPDVHHLKNSLAL